MLTEYIITLKLTKYSGQDGHRALGIHQFPFPQRSSSDSTMSKLNPDSYIVCCFWAGVSDKYFAYGFVYVS